MPDTRGIPYLSSGPGDTVSIADPDDPQERFVVQEFVPPKADLHSFDFGVAVSGWNVAATARYKGGRRIIGTCFGDHWTATKLPLTIVENGHKTSSHMAMAQVSAQIPTQYEAYDWTLQAYDHKGKCLDSFPMYRKDGMLLGVQNAKVSEISKAQLLVRPIHHFTFRNVALQPKG